VPRSEIDRELRPEHEGVASARRRIEHGLEVRLEREPGGELDRVEALDHDLRGRIADAVETDAQPRVRDADAELVVVPARDEPRVDQAASDPEVELVAIRRGRGELVPGAESLVGVLRVLGEDVLLGEEVGSVVAREGAAAGGGLLGSGVSTLRSQAPAL
jgi:hypothetical protein